MSNNNKFYKVVKLESIDNEYKEGELVEFQEETKSNMGRLYNTLWFVGKDDGLYRWQVEEVEQFNINQEVTFMEAVEAMEDGWIVQNESKDNYKVMNENVWFFDKIVKAWYITEFDYDEIKQTYKIIGRWA